MDEDPSSFCDFVPRKSTRKDHELMEILWQNGHLVMHSQAQPRASPILNELRQSQKTPLKCEDSPENPNNSVQEDETMPWFQFPLDDSLDTNFCSDFFYGMQPSDDIDLEKPSKDVAARECVNFGSTGEPYVFSESVSKQSSNLLFEESTITPSNTQVTRSITHASGLDSGLLKFSHFSRSEKAELGQPPNGNAGEKCLGNQTQVETGESSSIITKGSSQCGSNQFRSQFDRNHTWSNGATNAFFQGLNDDEAKFVNGRRQTETLENVVTSSSGGSGYSFGRTGQQITSNHRHKRKGRDAKEFECQSEEAECESDEANKQVQRSASTRKNRAAEIHNLSERRRRDRINEKMKKLQELIPYCNKSDKASMLDEAIEYLKSLQLQVQMMWMGSGMPPMIFSGVQQYVSRMGMGVGHSPLPSFHGHVQFPRLPLVNQSMSSTHSANQLPINPSPSVYSNNFQTQMQNAHLPESYARCLGFHHMQPEVQGMNLGMYGTQLGNQIQTSVPTSSSNPLSDGGAPPKTIQNESG